jgi:RND superfamily putative drug exporter
VIDDGTVVAKTASASSAREPAHSDRPAFRARIAAGVTLFTGRYRWPIAITWVLLVLAAAAASASLPSVLSGGGWYVDGSQSKQVADALGTAGMLGRGQTAIELVIHDREVTVDNPRFESRIRSVVDAVTADPVLKVTGRYGWSSLDPAGRSQFLGRDNRTVTDSIALGLNDGAARRELPLAQKRLTAEFGKKGLDVSVVSAASLWGAVNTQSQSDLILGELIVLPLIGLILLLLFRSLAAVAVSLAVGVSSIVFALAILTLVAHHIELSLFMENTATMLGLGVGVDYSLFVISRFQEELRHTSDVRAAVATALHHSGHAVVYSGLTVIAAMATLFLVDLNVIFSLALGAVTVVGFSILVTTLLLPALLQLVGTGINRGRPRFLRSRSDARGVHGATHWHWFATTVMRRPIALGTLGVLILAALAVPAIGLRTFSPDARILPHSSAVREGFDTLQQQFGVGSTSPVQVVVTAPAGLSTPQATFALLQLNDILAHLPHVASSQSVAAVLRAVPNGDPARLLDTGDWRRLPTSIVESVRHYLSNDMRTSVIELQSDHTASADETRQLVRDARQVISHLNEPQLRAFVGGETAEGVDANAVIEGSLIKVVLTMLCVGFVLLLVTFRSVALPIKGVVMNLLSLAGTYGILVLIFQHGFLTAPLGLERTGYLQSFVPVLLLALLFSMSTDYEVFLIGRIREYYRRSGDNRAAVADAVEATGPLISGAAVLMVAVFGAFALTGIMPIQQLGLGAAVGILIDATVVRLVLVPAAMRLLGGWNWWWPRRHASDGSPTADLNHHPGTGVNP